MPQYVYVFVRTDLPLRNQLVQACHACHHAGQDWGAPVDCNMVVLQVDSEYSLLRAAKLCLKEGVQHTLFQEPDLDDQYTAICTAPVQGEKRELFRNYKLWK